ncbi:hypothetical protein HV337_09190 [Citrobacter freundii]|jgi:hypothetical protein|uniref:P63C domain-containing protein n=1 Tax=Citrobacter freundii TaxID=546 RepID=UPI0015EAE94C|nr:P63C domain-containing protein [Citrobacter freundii]QLR72697.1 hypothetical protein HV337_09190 [Citrobacter freundii]
MTDVIEHEEDNEPKGKAKGGKARAAKMTPEERKAAAVKMTEAKKELAKLPEVAYGSPDTPLRIGDLEIQCYVLSDGARVLSQRGIATGLGWSGSAAGDRLLNLVGGDRVKPFFNNELMPVIENPIKFKNPSGGGIAHGYPATLLADICDALLAARKAGTLQKQQEHMAERAEILVRGFARVGIVALIDEVTGYQRDRKRDALAAILEKYIAKEMRPWLKTFQLEFFEELCRVWGYSMPEKPGAYPPVFAHVIRNIVYDRLAPGVRTQLQDIKKKKGGKMHQWLTGNAGYNDLTRHLGELTMLLRVTPDGQKDIFLQNLDKFKPVYTVEQLIEAADSKSLKK